MDELEGGWNGSFKSVNFYDYSSIHPSVIKPSNILGGTTMSLTFEKVDDILTEEAIYTMVKNFTRYSDQIKSTAMDLVYRSQNYDYETDARMFDDITAMSFALDAMVDTLREYQASYAALLGKYNELVKAE